MIIRWRIDILPTIKWEMGKQLISHDPIYCIEDIQQIGASVCSAVFCVHDVLIWNYFEFTTMCSITTLTQSKHTQTQYELKWYTEKHNQTCGKHNAHNVNTKLNFVLEHNISCTSKTHSVASWTPICWVRKLWMLSRNHTIVWNLSYWFIGVCPFKAQQSFVDSFLRCDSETPSRCFIRQSDYNHQYSNQYCW